MRALQKHSRGGDEGQGERGGGRGGVQKKEVQDNKIAE